jgi:integrase
MNFPGCKAMNMYMPRNGSPIFCSASLMGKTSCMSSLGERSPMTPLGHQFRHTFAKRLLIAGVPVGTVAILLGHRKVAITEKHYSRWITERQAVVDAAVRGSWQD